MIKQLSIILLLAAGLVACKAKDDSSTTADTSTPPATTDTAPAVEKVKLDRVQLSNAIGADKKAAADNSVFAKTDTIYASIETSGSGKATLKAKWSYVNNNELVDVDQTTQDIDASGPAVTEFHISKPDGWPVGSYQVEIWLDDASIAVKKFTVQ